MRTEQLRHKVTLQKLDMTQDTYGQLTETWTDVATVWAAVNPISGKEFFQAETVNSEITHKIMIRYMSGITPDMRVKFGDRYFNIISVINYQERNIDLQLMCKELI